MIRTIWHYINSHRPLRVLFNYIVMTVSSAIFGIGIANFLDPCSLAAGGISGLSIVINRLIPTFQTGTIYLLLNIPLILLGLWKFGIRFIISTAYCIFMSTVATNYFERFGAVTRDDMLAAIIGGALIAVAMGLIFKAGATTGGTDILVKVLKLKFPHMKTGVITFLIDIFVIATSAVIMQSIEKALFAGISVGVTSFVFDLVLYGRDGAKLFYIITDHHQNITERLLLELDIGVTHIQGQGAFSGKEKTVIMVVVKKPISPKVEEIVREEDPDAFMIITDATEIYGEGYKSMYSAKL